MAVRYWRIATLRKIMFWKNSIGKKLGLAFTFIILLFSIKTLYTIHSLQQLFTFTETIYKHPLPVSNSVQKIKVDSLKMYILMRDLVRAKDKVEMEKYLKLIDAFEADAFENLKVVSEKFLGDKNKVKDVNQLFTEWKNERIKIIAYLNKGEIQQSYLIVREDETRYLEKINKTLDEILNFAEKKAFTLYNEANQKEKFTIQTAYIILFFIIIISTIIGFLIVKAITNPIQHLRDTAQKISVGNIDIPISTNSSDEVEQLSKSFSIMTESLKSMIQAEKKRVNELKTINNQYTESLQKLNKTCQIAKIGFWELDLNSKIFSWTDEIYLICEVSSDFKPDLQNCFNFFINEDKEKIENAFEQLIQNNNPFNLELSILTKKGNVRCIQFIGEKVPNPINRNFIHGIIQDITEKEFTKNELIEKENKYKRLVDNIPGALYIFSNKRGGIYYSNRVESILGYSLTDLQENPFLWQQSILDEDKLKIRELTNNLKQDREFEVEYQIRTKSGELKWILDRSTHIKIQEDEIIIEGLAMDITERKQFEEALRKNEEQFRSLAENSTDYIMRYDRECRHIYANSACLKVSGKTWNEFIGKNHRELGNPPELSELWERKIQKVFETGEPQKETFEWKGAEGNIVIDWRVMPEYEYGTNKVISVLGVSRDISELKKSEKALRESENRFRNIVNASPVPIGMNDADLNITLINPAFTRAYGYTTDDLHTIDDWWNNAYPDPEYRKQISQTWFHHIEKAKEQGYFEPIEGKICCKDGSFKTVLSTANTMPSGETIVINYDITDRVKATKALRESEARARAMLSAIPDMVFRLNKEGIYLDYKADSKDLYAQSSKVIGVRNRDITPPEFADLIDEKTKLAIDTGELITFEFQLNIPNSGLHDYEARMIASGGDEVTSIVRDITSRKQTEEALKKSELRFRQLAESAPVGIYRTDETGYCIYVNERWCSITGLQEQEAMGVGWVKALHPDDKEKVFQKWDLFMRGQEAFHCEYRFIHKDNSIFWVTGTAAVETDPDGKVTGYIGTITDISNLKKIEESLWETKERLEVAASAGIIGIWDLDIVNNRQIWDNVMYKLYGITKEKWEGNYEGWSKTIHPEDRKYVEEEVQAAMRGEREYAPEFRIIWPDGSVHYIKAASKTIFNEQKKPIRMIGINYDLTEQKKVQQEIVEALKKAEAANKAKTEFLATMSHEIRTPMNAILGFTELLEKSLTEQKHLSYLKAIQSGGKTLLKLINDILDLAKIESGKIILQFETVDLNKLIEDVCSIFQQKIKEKKLEFIIDIEKSLPVFLVIDELRLRQIIFNLLGNAIKFTEKGYIKLIVKSVLQTYNGEHIDLNFTVEDTGIGIPKEECDKIFDSFYKFEPTGLHKYEGSGLGLNICKRLSHIMGGEISVKSKEGEGSIFTLILPKVKIANSENIIIHNKFEPIPDISSYKGTILVVDDIYSNRELIKESFIGTKITVLEAHNGLEAIELVKINRPDLILMDLKMPVMDGFESCQFIKNTDELKSIPIVAITASSLETQERLHIFDGYLRKPVSLSILYNEIKQYLNITENTNITVEDIDLPVENIEDLNQLLSILTETYLPQLEAFNKRQSLKDLKKFSSNIIKLGEQYKSKILLSYGKTILNGAEEFDMEKVRNTLWFLPDIIQKMKHFK